MPSETSSGLDPESEEPTERSDAPGIKLERVNLAWVAIGVMVSLYWQNRDFTLGFLAGGLMASLNLYLIRRIVAMLVAPSAQAQKRMWVLLLLKFFGTFAALGLLIWVLKLQAIGLLAGLSTLMLTVLFQAFWGAVKA